MTFEPGALVGHYRIVALLGTGGPACVRGGFVRRELRRGLAEAETRGRQQ